MDYSKVTMVEYEEKKKAILNSLGRWHGHCIGLASCDICFFNDENGNCKNTSLNEMENSLEMIKLVMDYEIPVDWSKVKVDTPILVRDSKADDWLNRYFAKYEHGTVYTFTGGATSWSSKDNSFDITGWLYAKLVNIESEQQK